MIDSGTGMALLAAASIITAAIVRLGPKRREATVPANLVASERKVYRHIETKYATKESCLQQHAHVSDTLKRIEDRQERFEKSQTQMMAMLARQQGGL